MRITYTIDMKYYEVSPVGIIRQDSAAFTYSSPEPLNNGALVEIEVGKKNYNGVIISESRRPSYPTKQIIRTIEDTPLPTQLLNLAAWLSEYYTTHPGVVWQTILPRGLTKNRRERTLNTPERLRDRTNFVLNESQLSALRLIQEMTPGSAILHGVTGSGKTAVYIEATRKTLSEGKSVIILTPEIGLTPQIVDDFSQHFENILVTHSRQTESERHLTWRRALNSNTPLVVIGPRSALFMPLKDIGLIVIDEAHEPSYKQEQSPRYSALRAASVLTSSHTAKLVLGSATPLIADFYTAKETERPIISIPHTAKAVSTPEITLVDMTKKSSFKNHRFLSDELLQSIRASVENGKQALIFHNRRGSASVTLCDVCGWQAICNQCHIPLTLHADTHSLQCHICGAGEKVPTSCPECRNANILHKGIGTKLVESEIRKLFPTAKIARFDGDNTKEDSIATNYKNLYSGAIQIIIGTQVVAKGLDLPHLQSVGIVQADAGLSLPDYSSSERTFQLLAQAVGRVGRSNQPTNTVIQSYQPTHPSVTYGIKQDYAGFYELALTERQKGKYPPYTFLLKLTCSYKTEATAIRNSRSLLKTLREAVPPTVQILGPAPSFYERHNDTYRWQLILKSSRRSDLVEALKLLPVKNWQSELDPVSLL